MNARQPGGTHEPRPGRGGASLDKEEKNTCQAQIHIERRLNSRPSDTQEEGARWGVLLRERGVWTDLSWCKPVSAVLSVSCQRQNLFLRSSEFRFHIPGSLLLPLGKGFGWTQPRMALHGGRAGRSLD